MRITKRIIHYPDFARLGVYILKLPTPLVDPHELEVPLCEALGLNSRIFAFLFPKPPHLYLNVQL